MQNGSQPINKIFKHPIPMLHLSEHDPLGDYTRLQALAPIQLTARYLKNRCKGEFLNQYNKHYTTLCNVK
jgi:hypothetical protein